MQTVNILGTEYKIETRKMSEDPCLVNNQFVGYCGEHNKIIVVADMDDEAIFPYADETEKENYRKETLRHEVIHAFFCESGLSDSANQTNGSWAKNEEMVDWFAIQSPKIFKVFNELEIL